MRKCALALLLFLSATTAADGRANVQSPSNFSGHWVLASVNPERPAYDQFWLGTETTVTQDGTSLVVSRLSPAPQREARFTLDRKESRNEYVVNGTEGDSRIARHVEWRHAAHQYGYDDRRGSALPVEYPQMVTRRERPARCRRYGDLREGRVSERHNDVEIQEERLEAGNR